MNSFLSLLQIYVTIMFCLLIFKVLRPAHENEFITGHYEFPPFHNLTELVINIEDYCHETLLDDFLQNSAKLESLEFPQVSLKTEI